MVRSALFPSSTDAFPGSAMSSRLFLPLFALVALAMARPTLLSAQEPNGAVRSGALSVYLDCNTRSCNSTYFRTEITFVNWARDRTLADVHLIVTSVNTGGGGQIFTLDYIGLGELEGTDDSLTATTLSTDTEAEVLEKLTRVMAVGLARHAALIQAADDLVITSTRPVTADTDHLVSPDMVDDPWNFWVFEIGSSFNLDGEETEDQTRLDGRVSARRTTDIWKVELSGRGDFRRREIEQSDGSTVVDERTNWNAEVLVVRTLAEQWSAGLIASTGASTSRNQVLGADGFGALEYSFTPYPEAPRRSMTAAYQVGMRYFDWENETIFGETSELRPQHVLRFNAFQRQPWGETRASVRGSQYLHDLDMWSLSLDGNLRFRVLRGLSLNLRGEMEWIEDQLFVSAEGLTDEDILLGRFTRPTDYKYRFSVGFTFEFGSIYNNVVNNRF